MAFILLAQWDMIRPLFMTVSWPKLLRKYVNQVAGVGLLLFVLNKTIRSKETYLLN